MFPSVIRTPYGVRPFVLMVAPSANAPDPVPSPAPPAGPAQFIADQRTEAHRLDATGMQIQARQHWRYVLALLPRDDEATGGITRLDALIKARRDAALAQGETALMRSRAAEAETAFLKALALDGGNQQARRRLLELETQTAFARQDRNDPRTRATRTMGTEGPEDER